MSIAPTLQRYLIAENIQYDVIPHHPTLSSAHTAEACRISGDCLAKAVVLRSDTSSLAPGSAGVFAAGCSTGFVVAALKAFSASQRESVVVRRAMLANLSRLRGSFAGKRFRPGA